MPIRGMKWAGLPLALALFFLSGFGPVWVPAVAVAQTVAPAALVGPMRIVNTPQGLLVGDYVGYKVALVNPLTLAVKEIIPVTAKPLSVAWMNGLVYVGDEKTGIIQVFQQEKSGQKNTDNKGNPKKVAGWFQVSADLTGFAIGGPADMVADEDLGLLFVASKTDKTVYVLDENGAVLHTIGGPASASPVGRPQGLALDRAGRRVFVSDDGILSCTWLGCGTSSAVIVFDYEGNFLGEISGSSGQAGYKFSRAQGVTLDGGGRVYLVDSYRSQVLVFDEISPNSWTSIGTFGMKGSGAKELLLPMDVVVDDVTSTVYVTNNMKGRIEAFTAEEMLQ